MADMAETLHGRFTGVDLDELVDRRVVLTWLYWGMFWLIVTPSVGVALSGLFNYPDYLGTNNLGLTFGRLDRSTSTASSSALFRPCSSANAITWCRAYAAFGWSGESGA